MSCEDVAAALASLLGPEEARRFTELDLRQLSDAGYTTLEDLRKASRNGLRDAKLKPARADLIITAQATSTELYKDITLYTPMDREEYFRIKYSRITRKQLAAKLKEFGYQVVLPVGEEPPQCLQLRDCKDRAQVIDVVELHDGMQLAVLVAEGLSPVDKLYKSVGQLQEQGAELSGCQRRRTEADEFMSSEWANDHLSGDKGAHRFCFKKVGGFVEGMALQIEVDGMAYSAQRVVLVERKPSINFRNVEELGMKEISLRKLVEARAPNTDVLRDPATGQIKPVETFLMADGWVEDPEQQAACNVRMLELNITPVLPRGGSHDVGDSCHTWPPQRTQQLLAQAQRFHSNNAKRLPPTGSSAGSTADGGGTGDGAIVRAARTGRHGGSASRIVSSPVLSGCTRVFHVAVGQHYRVTSCRPARLPHL